MIVTKDRVVSLTYDLRIDDKEGKLVQSIKKEAPLTFMFGTGRLLPKFEDQIEGLTKGEQFELNLSVEDAYGEFNEDAVINVPIKAFEKDGEVDERVVQLGNEITMQDKEGNKFNGKVLDINNEHVRMDFNHPLAGNKLHFTGEVIDIREATDEELSHGHIHSGCSCGDGCGCDNGSCT